MADKKDLIEKNICKQCSIVFECASECPRCGKSDSVDIYFDFEK